MKKSRITYLLVMLLTILGGCSSGSSSNPETQDQECITPETPFAFPVGVTPQPDYEKARIPPSGGWQIVDSIPGSSSVNEMIVNGNNEIWISTGDSVLRYNQNSMDWQKFTTVEGYNVIPETIYLSKDGTLWGIGLIYSDWKMKIPGNPLLSRFNPKTDQFEFVQDQKTMLHHQNIVNHPPKILEDNRGRLWIILLVPGSTKYGLYSYDPAAEEAETHILAQEGAFLRDFAILPQNIIWIIENFGRGLLAYDPESGKTTIYSDIPWQDGVSSIDNRLFEYLYLDQQGRLWIQDLGWLDFSNPENPLWYRIVRSPVFIVRNVHPENDYAWISPSETYQSSDGLYWFSSMAGMVRLNPEKAEWCLFTMDGGQIVEDNQQVLWLTAYGK